MRGSRLHKRVHFLRARFKSRSSRKAQLSGGGGEISQISATAGRVLPTHLFLRIFLAYFPLPR